MKRLTEGYQEVFLRRIREGHGSRWTERDKTLVSECKKKGIIPGRNRFRELCERSSGHIIPFAECLVTDILHSFYLGVFVYAIMWTLSIAKIYSEYELTGSGIGCKYRDCMGLIDERIKNLKHFKESLYPTQDPWHYPNGISQYISVESQKGTNRGRASAHLGGIPGTRMVGILFQLLLVIGCDPGTVLPNCNIRHGDKLYNPTKIICSTMAAVLELHWAVYAKKATDSDLKNMAYLIRNANVKLLELFQFYQAVLVHAEMKDVPKEFPNVLKCHLVGHRPPNVKMFGELASACDTNISEGCMKLWVKFEFSRSSKVLATTEKEMLLHVLERNLGELLWKHQTVFGKKHIATVESQEESEHLQFIVRNNMGSVVVLPVFGSPTERPRLEFEEKKDRSRGDRFHHPLLQLPQIFNLLNIRFRKEVTFAGQWLKNFFGPAAQRTTKLTFIGGIFCSGHESTELVPFYIRSDRGMTSERGREPAFSSVEVVYKDYPGTYFVKVMAILELRSLTLSLAKSELWLAVIRYKKTTEAKQRSILPYPQYKLEHSDQTLCWDLISVDDVKYPAFMQPLSLNVEGFETIQNSSTRHYFCIPFDRVVKFKNVDYDSCIKHNNEKGTDAVFQTQDALLILYKKHRTKAYPLFSEFILSSSFKSFLDKNNEIIFIFLFTSSPLLFWKSCTAFPIILENAFSTDAIVAVEYMSSLTVSFLKLRLSLKGDITFALVWPFDSPPRFILNSQPVGKT